VDRVEIGVVAKAHGIRGELRVALHNLESRALDQVESIYVGERAYALSAVRPVAGGALVRLAEVDDRNAAEALRGQPISIDRENLDLDDGEFLLSDLVGLRVELEDGTAWGQVVRVEVGVQSRMVVQGGGIERQLPIVDEFLVEVDLEAGRIVVDPPAGLPEEPARGGS